MSIANGNTPAMPIELAGFGRFEPEAHVGLTKREMFAMAAMQGLLASLTPDDSFSPSELARAAVLNADALLAELEQTE